MSQAPFISHSFASKQIKSGATWKVYLNASHETGQMKYIIAEINQPGRGSYPAARIPVRGNHRQTFSGYIYLNTFSPTPLNFMTLTLTVQIEDRSGRFSSALSFPLSILPRAEEETPPPGVFAEVDLGPIMVQLETTAP